MTDGEIGVWSVFSLFLTRVGVYVGAGVCIRTYTHTAHVRYSDVSPGVRMRHLEGPKNPGGLDLGIYVFVYVYKVLVCLYMLGGGIKILDYLFFFFKYIFPFEKEKQKM